MSFLTVSVTDKGLVKEKNEDSIYTTVVEKDNKKVSFSIVCDGMGGLAEGEYASAKVLNAFVEWFEIQKSLLFEEKTSFDEIKSQWANIVKMQNSYLIHYGNNKGIRLGTTVTALMIIDNTYYAVHVGDSRIYEISDSVHQITTDHTLVARDLEMGNITKEQARKDPRKNILLQCVGANEDVYPEFITGDAKGDVVYLLCSDGFYNLITEDEIYSNLKSKELHNEEIMKSRAKMLINLNKERMEKDNISAILVKIFDI
jgi:serine/threonine protein phosphatase PrpC